MNKIIIAVFIMFSQIQAFSQVTTQWVKRFNYSGNSQDVSSSTCVDNYGNVYVTGVSVVDNMANLMTIKYSSEGNQVWTANYSELNNYGPVASNSIKYDANGNLYVAGQYNGKLLLIKYNLNGNKLWSRYYNEQSDSTGYATNLLISSEGYIYVSGTFNNPNYAILIKYDQSGQTLWAAKYNDLQRYDEISHTLVEDENKNVYSGIRSSVTVNYHEYVLVKYNSNGIFQWAKVESAGGNEVYRPRIAADLSGNVFIAGNKDAVTGKDFFISKYNSEGNKIWERTGNGTANSDDQVNSIISDNNSNVYVTGTIINNITQQDCFVKKYSSDGDLVWSSFYDGNNNNIDVGSRIMLDNAGNIFVAGCTYTNNSNGYDYLLVKYDQFGTEKWATTYNGPGNNTDIITGITLNNTGDIYITGWSSGGATEADFATIKYSQTIGIEPIAGEIPTKFSLLQNYPNPFNPVTNIKFEVPKGGFAKLTVFDMLGREIAVLVDQNVNAGTYNVEWDASSYPSGVYFYKMVSGGFVETKKMMLVK